MEKEQMEREPVAASFIHEALTKRIIGAYYNVYNRLGYGFLEKCYERAMVIELGKLQLPVQQQVPLKVYYDGQVIGDFIADMLVDKKVIVELKATSEVVPAHIAQLTNYLRATEIEVGLMLNFGLSAKIVRRVESNEFKKNLHTLIT